MNSNEQAIKELEKQLAAYENTQKGAKSELQRMLHDTESLRDTIASRDEVIESLKASLLFLSK